MRKKCTNSSCRRTFSVKTETQVSCPHCGKVYPRIAPAPAVKEPVVRYTGQQGWSVVLLNWRLGQAPIKVIRKYAGCSSREAKEMAVNRPSVVKCGLYHQEAKQIVAELLEAGAVAEAKCLTNREMRCYYTVQAAGEISR